MVPETFVEGELQFERLEGFKTVSVPQQYDIFSVQYDIAIKYPENQSSYDYLTEAWDGWEIDKQEVQNHGVAQSDKKVGNHSLWYDVQHSDKSNTWIVQKAGLNLSEYNSFLIYIKSNASLEWQHTPSSIGGGTAIYLGTGEIEDRRWFRYDIDLTDNWQIVLIPFSSFITLNNPSLEDINFILLSVWAEEGSPNYRVWIDGIDFLKEEVSKDGLALYLNGKLIPFVHSEISNVWSFSSAYGDVDGKNEHESLKNKIILSKTESPFIIRNLTLGIRLYPNKYYYYGYADISHWSGVCVDYYEWNDLGEIAGLLRDAMVVASLSKRVFVAKLNGHDMNLNVDRYDVTIYGKEGEGILLRNAIKIPIEEHSNCKLEIRFNENWFTAQFYFMHLALWPLRESWGMNCVAVLVYMLLTVSEGLVIMLYHKHHARGKSIKT